MALTISERRDIIPVDKLEVEDEKLSEHSSKYYMDMRSRKLPPPAVFYSENEKDAFMKNRNEQARLQKLLEHVTVQKHVFSMIHDRDEHVMQRRKARFLDRVKHLNKWSVDAEPTPEETKKVPEKTTERNNQISVKITRAASAKYSSKTLSRTNSCASLLSSDSDSQSSTQSRISNNLWKPRPKTAHPAGLTKPRSQSSIATFGNEQMPASVGKRSKSAFPANSTPSLSPSPVDKSRSPSSSGRTVSRQSGVRQVQGTPTNISKPPVPWGHTAQTVRQELRRQREKRHSVVINTFNHQAALATERDEAEQRDKKVELFIQKVKAMGEKSVLTKWDLQELEQRLKLY